MPNSRCRGAGAAGLMAVALAAFTPGCRQKQQEPAPLPPLVAVATTEARDVPQYLDEIGTTRASEVVTLRAQATGRITAIHFTDGADVQKGDLLFTIDPAPYEAALHQAEASVIQSQASLVLAQKEFERAQRLIPSQAISQEDYETRQSAVAVVEAQIKAGQAAVETARVNLDYTQVHSPLSGRTGERLVDPGNVVTAAATTPLLTVQRLEPIYADFTITERDLPEVRRHMVDATLITQVSSPDDRAGTAPAEGSLTLVDNSVLQGTGTVMLRATIPNTGRLFWPGQFVRVRLILSTLKDAVLAPAAATQISQQGPYMYVVTGDSKADLRQVKLGQRHGDFVVVEQGVKAGERVVTSGQLGVTPGAPVRIQEPAAPPTGASGPTGTTGATGDSPAPAGDHK